MPLILYCDAIIVHAVPVGAFARCDIRMTEYEGLIRKFMPRWSV